MQELFCESKRLRQTNQGTIVEVAFRGHYSDGAAGNDCATAMQDCVGNVLSTDCPVGVLLNMIQLEYQWGDAMGTIAVPLLRNRQSSPTLACVVADGKTAEALEWFFQYGMLFQSMGMDMFCRVADGLDFLERRISRSRRTAPETIADARERIAADFEVDMQSVLARVVARERSPTALYALIMSYDDRIESEDPDGYEILGESAIPEYAFFQKCYTHWEHYWHDLGSKGFPIPDSVEEMFFANRRG